MVGPTALEASHQADQPWRTPSIPGDWRDWSEERAPLRQSRLTPPGCQSRLTDMDIEELGTHLSSDDPARWSTRLVGPASPGREGRGEPGRSSSGKRLVVAADRRCVGRHPPIRAHQIQQGVIMTTEPVAPEVRHAWAVYLRASEEARRRGDRRTGTDHLLLALLEDPSIEGVLGVSLQQARQALESLDQEAFGALGLRAGTDAPPLPIAPCRRSRGSETFAQRDRLRMTPAAKKVLEEAVRPNRRKLRVTAQQVLNQILALRPPDAAAVAAGRFGRAPVEVRHRLDRSARQLNQVRDLLRSCREAGGTPGSRSRHKSSDIERFHGRCSRWSEALIAHPVVRGFPLRGLIGSRCALRRRRPGNPAEFGCDPDADIPIAQRRDDVSQRPTEHFVADRFDRRGRPPAAASVRTAVAVRAIR